MRTVVTAVICRFVGQNGSVGSAVRQVEAVLGPVITVSFEPETEVQGMSAQGDVRGAVHTLPASADARIAPLQAARMRYGKACCALAPIVG